MGDVGQNLAPSCTGIFVAPFCRHDRFDRSISVRDPFAVDFPLGVQLGRVDRVPIECHHRPHDRRSTRAVVVGSCSLARLADGGLQLLCGLTKLRHEGGGRPRHVVGKPHCRCQGLHFTELATFRARFGVGAAADVSRTRIQRGPSLHNSNLSRGLGSSGRCLLDAHGDASWLSTSI